MKKNKNINLEENHIALNRYIRSLNWRSFSSNEIVEYCIRKEFIKKKAVHKVHQKKSINNLFKVIILFLLLPFSIPLYLGYLYFLISKRKAFKELELKNVHFVRNKLALERFNKIKAKFEDEKTIILYDDFLYGLDSSYKLKCKISNYIPNKPLAFVIQTIKETCLMTLDFFENVPWKHLNTYFFFMLRIPHLIMLKLCLENISSLNNLKKVSSFEMISRYGSILNDVFKNKDIETIGYPHGLEYDINYPNGVFGKKIFVTSNKCKLLYEIKYPDKNLNYNSGLIKKLFFKEIEFKPQKHLIYFTDSRNPKFDYDNLKKISKISKLVKFHPSEKKSLFKDLNIIEINDFNEALSYGKVLMRPSTVIFESFISGCETFCLNTNLNEEYSFNFLYPTLSDLKINNVKNLDRMIESNSNAI